MALNSPQRPKAILNKNPNDLFETPYCLTRLLLDNEEFHGIIEEPACGKGAITSVLAERYFLYSSFDLERDFLTREKTYLPNNIITNPPFKLSHQFILKAKEIATHKIAMLLPFNYLHGKKRYAEIWSDTVFPLKTVYILTRYLDLSKPLREDGRVHSGGMIAFAWFVWEKGTKTEANLKFINVEDYLASRVA